MFKNKITDEYMYPILGYDNYSISRSGLVALSHRKTGNCDRYQDYTVINPYINHGIPYVVLLDNNGQRKHFSVARLNIISTYGDLPFKIVYNDGDPMNVLSSNLRYDITAYKIVDDLEVDNQIFHGKSLLLLDDHKTHAIFRPFPKGTIFTEDRYWVSRNGAIFDRYKMNLLSRSNDDHGYYKVSIQIPPRMINGHLAKGFLIFPKIHTLVYMAWAEDADLQGWTIDHVDGRRHNCDISNLEKVSLEENIIRRNQRNIDDENVITSRWKPEEIHIICQMLQNNETYSEIAEAFGIDSTDKTNSDYVALRNVCKAIIDGRTFKYIAKDYQIHGTSNKVKHHHEYKTPTKFNTKIIEKICIAFVEGKNPAEVHRMYPEIPLGTIQGIKQGRQYQFIAQQIPGMNQVIAHRKPVSSIPKSQKITWSDEQCRLICEMLQAGKSNVEIAEALGFKYDESFKSSANIVAVRNIINALYTGRQHQKIASQYHFPENRNSLGFPNSGRFTSNIKQIH